MFTVFRANHKCQLLLEIFCLIAVINIALWVRKWKTVVRLFNVVGPLDYV